MPDYVAYPLPDGRYKCGKCLRGNIYRFGHCKVCGARNVSRCNIHGCYLPLGHKGYHNVLKCELGFAYYNPNATAKVHES